ncbi:hypothetical protein [Streptomyces sp. NPDC004134]|uniref:hypothetical protein n=1 Tax=Streptomyces sp. NPDC004134 TaxID=3364691 RepID=UPI0036AA2E6A
MRRGAVAVAAVVLGAVVAAGCGEESGAGGPDTPSSGGSPSTAEEYAEATRKDHDRAWPGIARECRDVRPEPSAEAGDGGEGPVPENPKYGENNAYKQTTDVTPGELCRGEGHAARIAAALKDAAPADLGDEDLTRRIFEDLGYTGDTVSARANDGGLVWWDVLVAGAGPCISGTTDPATGIDVHGVYMEGGCTEPAGGH